MNTRYIPLYLIVVAMLGLSPAAQGQSALRKANKHFENHAFALALRDYQRAILQRPPDLATMQRIADAYRLTRQDQQAEHWYAKVVEMPGRAPINLYFYAEALRSNGKYEAAKKQYMLWGEEVPAQEERAQLLVAACEQAEQWMRSRAVAEVVPLQNLNDAGHADFSPMPYGRNGLIFSSDRGLSGGQNRKKVYGWTGRPYLQLFAAQQDEQGNWGEPVPLREISNDGYHNATAVADQDSKTLFFTRTQMVRKRNQLNPDPTSWQDEPAGQEYVNRLEIFSAEQQDGGWGNIKPFAYNQVEAYSVGHPALSPNGQVLYFASDMPGGMGETDIYYCLRQHDGSWGQPVNAGPAINTAGRESFPYVDAEGRLFFASDGHPGMGGLDIFRAEGKHAAWSEVKNMGFPINSPKQDYGIMFTRPGETGLLSSNRNAVNGTDDIFMFRMQPPAVVLAIRTLERKQGADGPQSTVVLPDVKIEVSGENLNRASVVNSGREGTCFMDGRRGSAYVLRGTKAGYLNQEATIAVPPAAGDTLQITLLFDKNEVDKAIVLDNIYYDLDKWNIRPDAARELDKLIKLLEHNPQVQIELSAHTDSRESLAYNQVLSERRAKAAVDYLASKGINRNRLRAKGYGKTRLVNNCTDGVACPEEAHQLNRRTEFKIIEN